jgi:pimeloyl-ACP methyl ester carboxylesterase
MRRRQLTKRDGAALGYTVLGSDAAPRTLVCHPGGPGMSGAYFGDMCGLGSEDLRVVLLDPRGTGSSDPPADGRYELADYAADLEELRQQLGLERFDYLGHSHGGFVGMTYALEQPDRLDHLVLACTTARFSDELRAEAEAAFAAHSNQPWYEDAVEAQRRRQAREYKSRAELADLYTREMRLWFADDATAKAFLSDFSRQRPDPQALGYFNSRIAPDYDIRPCLGEIRVPTLILNGGADFFGPRASTRELSAIPGSRAAIIPGAGHFAFADAPDRFRSELERFMRL